ncbi:MAG: hybrid sensor histidine kinase/response regulator [Chloroflexota bacterium]|nr:hybrid sensor histidine kinase/response regulator [Chloroflexota bacterium]
MIGRRAQEGERKQTVMIVDDDESLAQAIGTTLDMEGLQTVVIHDGKKALALARSLKLDLILLDVMLPGKSGIEVCATLKADPATASIPIILISAKSEQVDRAVGLAAGASEYLTKPFIPTELIALVDDVLASRPVAPRRERSADLPTMPVDQDQLVIYARELKELVERERRERKSLEEAHWQLGEVDRLKTAFLGVVTHELMTPFSDIDMTLQILERQTRDAPPELQATRDKLAAHVADLRRMVGGMVKFAELVRKRREPQPMDISLAHLIPEAVKSVAALAGARDVGFQLLMPSELPLLRADPELLSEAVYQMAHNAVKFNTPGGNAWVKAFESDSGNEIVIEVGDTGVGLTPEQMVLLGQPFEQSADSLRRGQEGLGLGWTFVCYVAEVHGGRTSVKSLGPGRGSIFQLILPLATGER